MIDEENNYDGYGDNIGENNEQKAGTVSADVAGQDVDAWLDYKKVSPGKRDEYQDAIDEMKDSISEGYLSLNEDYSWELKLKFPLKDGKLDKLLFKPRITDIEVDPHMKGVKAQDMKGTIRAHIAALTGEARGVVGKMDKEDMRIAQSIATFFM